MKKSFIAIILVVLVAFTAIPVNAEQYSSALDVTYEYTDDKIYITAELVDITADAGLIAVEYAVLYDDSALELVNVETIFPESWDDLRKNGMVEEIKGVDDNNIYRWAVVVIALGRGVKNDNELGVKLEFKPLKKETTTVELEYYNIATEVVEDGETIDLPPVSGESVSFNVDFTDPVTPDINKSDVSVETDVSEPNSESSAVVDVSDTASSDNSSSVIPNNNPIAMPSIEANVTSSQADDTSDNGNGSWIMWALAGIGVVAVAVVAVFVVGSKRGKK